MNAPVKTNDRHQEKCRYRIGLEAAEQHNRDTKQL
jgi:hypothetical protein